MLPATETSEDVPLTSACSAKLNDIKYHYLRSNRILVQGKLKWIPASCVAGVCICTCRNPRLALCWILWSSVTESRLLVLPCEVRMLQKYSYHFIKWIDLVWELNLITMEENGCTAVKKKTSSAILHLVCACYYLTVCAVIEIKIVNIWKYKVRNTFTVY